MSQNLKQLVKGPIFTVMTYQGYDINGYMFYTARQDKKSSYQNSVVHVDAYDNKGECLILYYGQIQEILEIEYLDFQVPLFRCTWVDGKKGVLKDKYGFTIVDLKYLGYKYEPFVLVKHVARVSNITNKKALCDSIRKKKNYWS